MYLPKAILKYVLVIPSINFLSVLCLQPISLFPFFSDSKSDEEDKERSTITEYILIACLGAFGFVLIAIIYLVVQLTRLNKSVRSLKATSQR